MIAEKIITIKTGHELCDISEHVQHHVHCESEKIHDTCCFIITLANVNRLTKFFYQQIPEETCYV